MDQERFHKLCLEASGLAVKERDRIGNLRLTQKNDRNEPLIREPEMLHAFCRTLDDPKWEIPYGIEVPTKGLYRFVDEEGEKTVRARHDLVLFDGANSDVLVELKTGQPSASGDDHPAISKDLRKLLLEKAGGKCMFHICHASGSETLSAVIKKYDAAFTFAKARVEETEAGLDRDAPGWFAVFVLVLYDRLRNGEPVLHRYVAQSLSSLLDRTPVFHPNCFLDEEILGT